jgi:hypothetical protein
VDVALELRQSLCKDFSRCLQSAPCWYQPHSPVFCIPNMMTVVVPSPTSSSCVLLSSIMLLAAGCATSISRRIAWPSLVRTMPPMGSSSIFSMALGPRHDLMMSATVLAAVMLDICALRPNCRSPPGVWVSVVVLVGCRCFTPAIAHTHNNYGRLHLE